MRIVILPVLIAGEWLLHRIEPGLFHSGIPVAAGLVGYSFLWFPRSFARLTGAALLFSWGGWVLAFGLVMGSLFAGDQNSRWLVVPLVLLHLTMCFVAARLLAVELERGAGDRRQVS